MPQSRLWQLQSGRDVSARRAVYRWSNVEARPNLRQTALAGRERVERMQSLGLWFRVETTWRRLPAAVLVLYKSWRIFQVNESEE